MKTSQEYGSELNAVALSFRAARETNAPAYAVECKYGWITSGMKPGLRYGKVWECRPDGTKHHG